MLWSLPHLYETAAACATELVSNAVRHVRWSQDSDQRVVWLVTSIAGPFLLVEVCDPDRTLPTVGGPVDWDGFDWTHTKPDDGLGERGFGLFSVVERVHQCGGEFGMVQVPSGKTVFFALPTGAFPEPDSARECVGSTRWPSGA